MRKACKEHLILNAHSNRLYFKSPQFRNISIFRVPRPPWQFPRSIGSKHVMRNRSAMYREFFRYECTVSAGMCQECRLKSRAIVGIYRLRGCSQSLLFRQCCSVVPRNGYSPSEYRFWWRGHAKMTFMPLLRESRLLFIRCSMPIQKSDHHNYCKRLM